MTKIDVKIDEEFSTKLGFQVRKASLKVGSSTYRVMRPAINPKKGIKKITRTNFIGNGILENVIEITLDELDGIDGNINKQRDFILRTMKVDAESVFVLNIIRLILKRDQKLTQDRIKYIANLFTLYSYKTISIVPFVFYYEYRTHTRQIGGIPTQVKKRVLTDSLDSDNYYAFVKSFIKEIEEHGYTDELGLAIPSIPLNKIDEYNNLYKDLATPIAVSDAHGLEQITMMPQVRNVEYSPGTYSLKEKNGEKYILYGFDAMKSKMTRSSGEIVGARNFAQLLYKFSSFGPTYTYPVMGGKNRKDQPIPEPRIYVAQELGYAKKTYGETLKSVEAWISEYYHEDKEGMRYSNYVKDFEAIGLSRSFDLLFDKYAEKAGDDKVDRFIENSALKSDTKRIKSAFDS